MLVQRTITLQNKGVAAGPFYNVYYSLDCVTYTFAANVFLPYVGSTANVVVDNDAQCIKMVCSQGTCIDEAKIIEVPASLYYYDATQYECVSGACNYIDLIQISNATYLTPNSGFYYDPLTGFNYEVLDTITSGSYTLTAMTGTGSISCDDLCTTTTTTTTTTTSTTTTTTTAGPCVCYIFENQSTSSSDIEWYSCAEGPTSDTLSPGQSVTRCVDTREFTPFYSGGFTSIITCSVITTCGTDTDCSGCVTTTTTSTTTTTTSTTTTTTTTTTTAAPCLCYTLLNETGGALDYSYTQCGAETPVNDSLAGGANIQICSSDLPAVDPGITSTPCTSTTNCTQDSDCTGCS